MGAKFDADKLLKRLDALQKKYEQGAKEVEIGVTDRAIATYATYTEFGWVQRVTRKQKYWFIQQGVSQPPDEGASLVNPPRPFLRGTLRAEGDKWMNTLAQALRTGRAPYDALRITGTQAAQDVRTTIETGGTRLEKFADRAPMTMELIKPSKEKTRKRKGQTDTALATREQPLMLTGNLRRSISFQVK